jgi:hypothetical protein
MKKLIILFLLISTYCAAQPTSYFTFEKKTPANSQNFTDSTGLYEFNFSQNVNSYNWLTTGAAGRSVQWGAGTSLGLASTSAQQLFGSFSYQFCLRIDKMYNGAIIIDQLDGSHKISFSINTYVFNSSAKIYTLNFLTNTTTTGTDDWRISLDGIDRASLGYYTDGNFHTFAFVYNATTGLKQVFVDGVCPSGFSKTISPGNLVTGANHTTRVNSTVPYRLFYGALDELAIYNTALSPQQVYQNYLNISAGQHYQYTTTITTVPTAPAVTAGLDTNDFAPTGMTALQQLQLSPRPRYKQGNTMHPLFNWVDMVYMGGRFQPGVSDAQSATNDTTLQVQLCKYFNYMIYCTQGTDQWSAIEQTFGNRHPEWKLSTITKRAQLSPSTLLTNQSLPASAYLRNASGQFIDRNGNVTTTKTWSPSSSPALFAQDGQTVKGYLAFLRSKLTRPVDFVNENGEVIAAYDVNILALDPSCVAAQSSSGLNMAEWQGRQFSTEETQSYWSAFTGDFPNTTKFTYYAEDGYYQYRFWYKYGRTFQSTFNGQWYSTVDYYPRRDEIWRPRNTAYNGMQWLLTGRNYEIAAGDTLYSPFVAAGWSPGFETEWIQSTHWNALMKNLGAFGADFYYTGFFNEAGNYNPPNPAPVPAEKYAYQLLIPAYAQAVTSRAETIFRRGILLGGDVPQSIDPPEAGNGNYYFCGDPRVFINVRRQGGNKYFIAASLNNISNQKGQVENSKNVTFTLDGTDITIEVRKQGSVYVLDKSVSPQVFYQLDGWHSAGHPARWTKDFNIEAELYDGTKNFTIKTDNVSQTNLTSYDSYLTWQDTTTVLDTVKYNFIPTTDSTYYCWFRLRSRTGASTGVTVTLNGSNPKVISGITSTDWYYYRYVSTTPIKYVHVDSIQNVLGILPSNKFIQIDKFTLTPDSTLTFPEDTVITPCGTVTATITPSGSTTFCSGNSITLQANSMTSYLWSTGATTRSITVSTSGTYTVTVTDPSGCTGTSSGTVVTVNTTPATPIINASGATIFCTGGSVTLTSSAASGNVWSTGATTQAISATTSGSYTVTVTATGCSATSAPTVVTVNTRPTATITPSGATTFCSGGSVTLFSSAGTSYLWSTAQTSPSIVVTTSGTYTVTVTNAAGCTTASSGTVVTVNTTPSQPVITAGGAVTFCNGDSVTLTSSASSTYLWSTGATTQAIKAKTTGNYIVTVSNGSCTATSSPTAVTVNPTPTSTISANGSTNLCTGQNVTLSANTATSYLWSTGATSQSILVSAAGTYTVTVTSNGCTASPSTPVVVTVTSSPTPTITPSGATTFCTGSSVTLTSSAATNYLWSTGATTQSINVSTTGNYTVFITTGTCTATSTPTAVTVKALPTATISPSGTVTICNGGAVTLSANSNTSYLWSTGATTQSISATTGGAYTVTVTTNSCSRTSAATTVTAVSVATPTITATGATTFCTGDSVILTSSLASGYQWSTGAVTRAITVKTAGTYSVTVTSNGCTAASSGVAITVNSKPTPIITYTGDPAPCIGSSVTLSSNYVSGNLWSTGATTQSISVTTTANYTLATTVSSCTGNANRTVTFIDCSSTCTPPTNLSAPQVYKYSAYIDWSPTTGANNYIVFTYSKGVLVKKTTVRNTSAVWLLFLKPNNSYQVIVQAVCGTTPSGNSETLIFNTKR